MSLKWHDNFNWYAKLITGAMPNEANTNSGFVT